jgi:hypothetical protein
MPFDVSEKPIIAKRQLDDTKIIIQIDTEAKDMHIEAVMEDIYDSGAITRSRPRIILRDEREGDAKYTNALNRLLPTAPKDPWTNPRETFINLAMQILSEEIV